MDNRAQPIEVTAASEEEVAAWLSASEGRTITVIEVRQIQAQAMRKFRQAFKERGISVADLLPDR